MDIEDVNRCLANIEREKDDPERAHDMQDDLFRDVLRAIADGETDNAAALALAALKVDKIEFARYTA